MISGEEGIFFPLKPEIFLRKIRVIFYVKIKTSYRRITDFKKCACILQVVSANDVKAGKNMFALLTFQRL